MYFHIFTISCCSFIICTAVDTLEHIALLFLERTVPASVIEALSESTCATVGVKVVWCFDRDRES